MKEKILTLFTPRFLNTSWITPQTFLQKLTDENVTGTKISLDGSKFETTYDKETGMPVFSQLVLVLEEETITLNLTWRKSASTDNVILSSLS